MHNGESLGGNSGNGEASGNTTPREINRQRGEMTVQAEIEARMRALLEERAKLELEHQELEREVARMRGVSLNAEESVFQQTATAMPEATWAVPPENKSQSETSSEGENQNASNQPASSTPESAPASTQNATQEQATANTPESDPGNTQTAERAKRNRGFKKFMIGAGAIALAGIMGLTAFFGNRNKNKPDQNTVATEAMTEDETDMPETIEEANQYAGELANGVHYNYSEYADIENKVSKNAFGYDKSSAFGNREATEDAWLGMADLGPEYLAAYAVSVFTDAEKQALGIAGMNRAQLDDYLSNAANIDGGEKQRNIMAALEAIARDKENTIYDFYYEEGTENTFYITFEDLNKDGKYSPDELKLCYTAKKRNGAPQVDIYRMINGQRVKVLDLNMECGMQPNEEQPPEDLPPIPPGDDDSAGSETSGNEPTGSEPSGNEPTGSEPSGNEPTGSEPSGNEPTGSEPSGNEGTNPDTAGNEGTDVKNPAAEIRNASENADQLPLDQTKTPQTTLEQDQANFAAIEQQRQQDEANAAAAAQAAAAKAEAERQAAADAEARRQQEEAAAAARAQADAEAAQRAEAERQAAAAAAQAAAEQAIREQAAQAEAERRAAAERDAAARAQAEADAQAAAQAATAATNAGDTASDRANDFANGNF